MVGAGSGVSVGVRKRIGHVWEGQWWGRPIVNATGFSTCFNRSTGWVNYTNRGQALDTRRKYLYTYSFNSVHIWSKPYCNLGAQVILLPAPVHLPYQYSYIIIWEPATLQMLLVRWQQMAVQNSQQKNSGTWSWIQRFAFARKKSCNDSSVHEFSLTCFKDLSSVHEFSLTCFKHLSSVHEFSLTCFKHLSRVHEFSLTCFKHLSRVHEFSLTCFKHLSTHLYILYLSTCTPHAHRHQYTSITGMYMLLLLLKHTRTHTHTYISLH